MFAKPIIKAGVIWNKYIPIFGRKNKELIKNLTQTISKELKRPNGGNKKLIDTLQKILDKAS